MPARLTERPVTGWLRWLMRLPVWLYRARLGWLLGDRFLMLTHTGRRSGQPRQVVLEVVRHDRESGAYVVAAAWGEKADWFRNVRETPAVVVHAGGRRIKATAACLPAEAGERELLGYARQHPLAFGELTRLLLGERLQGAPEDNCRRLAQSMPLVMLLPREAQR